MTVAQKLYEGMDLGKGEVGLITYMRTDSVRISAEFQNETLGYITKKYGSEYVPSKPNIYKGKKNKKQKIQDAHEAIRPTSLEWAPEEIGKRLDRDLLRLYTLIWNRYIASQMKPARIDSTTIDIQAGRTLFRSIGEIVTFLGFMRVYTEGKDEMEEQGETILPSLAKGEVLKVNDISHKQNFTQPPPRFTEATLVKTLEENGIGRPSTYATILSTIVNREYVVKDKKKFSPTELGILITDLLVDSFPEVLNVEFTARMEEQLDSIEEGKLNWIQCLHQFYRPFSSYLEKAQKQMRDVKKEAIDTDITCPSCKESNLVIKWGRNGSFLACPDYPKCTFTSNYKEDTPGKIEIVGAEQVDLKCEKCGGPFVVKSGRYGRFLACSNYPKCKNTREFTQNEKGDIQVSESVATDEICSLCHAGMVIKKGRYGKFLACSNYPKCKFIKPISLGVACPEEDCNGYLTEKTSRRGKLFFSCSRYPDCKFATWDRPVPNSCPVCKNPYMVIKSSRNSPEFIVCPDCGHKESSRENAA
jgi:DNA topoisomerase-1